MLICGPVSDISVTFFVVAVWRERDGIPVSVLIAAEVKGGLRSGSFVA